MIHNSVKKSLRILSRSVTVFIIIFTFSFCSAQNASVTEQPPADAENKGPSYLGVLFSNHPRGVRIVNIYPGSPADKAGLQKGEIITHVNSFPVGGELSLKNTIRSYSPGTSLQLRIINRKGETEEKTAVTELLPEGLLSFPETGEPAFGISPYK